MSERSIRILKTVMGGEYEYRWKKMAYELIVVEAECWGNSGIIMLFLFFYIILQSSIRKLKEMSFVVAVFYWLEMILENAKSETGCLVLVEIMKFLNNRSLVKMLNYHRKCVHDDLVCWCHLDSNPRLFRAWSMDSCIKWPQWQVQRFCQGSTIQTSSYQSYLTTTLAVGMHRFNSRGPAHILIWHYSLGRPGNHLVSEWLLCHLFWILHLLFLLPMSLPPPTFFYYENKPSQRTGLIVVGTRENSC